MNRNFVSYIISIATLFAFIALIPSELSMIIGAGAVCAAAIGLPFGFMAGIALVCLVVFALFSVNFSLGIFMAASVILPGWIMGVLIRKRRNISVILSGTALVRSGLMLLCYKEMADIESTTIKNLIMGESPSELIYIAETTGAPANTEEILTKMWEFMGEIIPAVVLISGLSFAFFALICTKLMTRRAPIIFSGIRKVSDIKMDVSFTVCALIICALAFIKTEFQIMFVNCFYVIYIIYLISGFAFLYRILKKAIKAPVAAFAITFVINMFTFGMLLPIMGIIGSFIKTDYDKIVENTENKINNEDEIGKDE